MTSILIYFRLPDLTTMNFIKPLMNMPFAESDAQMNMVITMSDVLGDKWKTGKSVMAVVA